MHLRNGKGMLQVAIIRVTKYSRREWDEEKKPNSYKDVFTAYPITNGTLKSVSTKQASRQERANRNHIIMWKGHAFSI